MVGINASYAIVIVKKVAFQRRSQKLLQCFFCGTLVKVVLTEDKIFDGNSKECSDRERCLKGAMVEESRKGSLNFIKIGTRHI